MALTTHGDYILVVTDTTNGVSNERGAFAPGAKVLFVSAVGWRVVSGCRVGVQPICESSVLVYTGILRTRIILGRGILLVVHK